MSEGYFIEGYGLIANKKMLAEILESCESRNLKRIIRRLTIRNFNR